MFRFLSKHIKEEDIDGCVAIIKNGVEDIASRLLWVIGEASLSVMGSSLLLALAFSE